MQPGFLTVATLGNPPTEIPRPTAGRRAAAGRSPNGSRRRRTRSPRASSSTACGITISAAGIVATLDNFGKMGEPPTHPELLDWLAVEFMNARLEPQAAPPPHDDVGRLPDGVGLRSRRQPQGGSRQPLALAIPPQRLDAETIRDNILAASGGIDLKIGGTPIFPHVPEDILDTEKVKGTWENQPDGPAVWRRSIYVYQRRSLPFPMFETFDHPDMNISAGQRNVSTVPTQALTLMNNPFVVRQAELLAERVTVKRRGI